MINKLHQNKRYKYFRRVLKALINDFKFPDKKEVLVFLLVPLCLSCIHYFGEASFTISFLRNIGLESFADQLNDFCFYGPNPELNRLMFWVIILDTFYFLVPLLFIRFVLKAKPADFGLRLGFEKGGWKLYLLMLCFMIPLVLYFSGTQSFQDRYPFYNIKQGELLWPNFWTWELFYFSQFFCLEFFFRGFMVNGLKNKLGIYSVFVMTIPYCMIHFGKPMPETIAAIVAGIVLGFLSFRNNSIFLGFFLHISVALSMDLAALWREGFFG
ncbi:MAG: type II CAAX prenyl endopeptidase Rce1 family protein [Bacteroidia bacterium]